MKTTINFKEIKNRSEVVNITGGSNGYPSPCIGWGILPDSKESFEAIRELLPDVQLYQFHRRDGWDMWEVHGPVYDLSKIEPSESDFGDNYTLVKILEGEDKNRAAAEIILGMTKDQTIEEGLTDVADEKEWPELKEKIETLANELQEGLNLLENMEWVQMIDPLQYSFDTHQYAVGFWLDSDDENDAEIIELL